MRARAAGIVLGGIVGIVVLLAACSSGGSTTSSTSSSTSSGQGSVAAGPSASGSSSSASGGVTATFQARGCDAPTSDEIGTAFGTPITKATPTSDNGCLWEAGAPTTGVQVSYLSPADFTAARAAVLKAGSTQVTVPGANDAFIKRLALPNGATNDVEYILFNDGTVEIAFTGATGSLTDQNEGAVTKAIVG